MPEYTSDNSAEYHAEDAQALVDEVFSGRLLIAEAIQRLRTRLLDLSSRNRLLRYVYPKRRCVRFIDNPDLNIIFDRLLDGKSVLLRPVPDPPPLMYEQGKKPEARAYAEQHGFNTDYEFSRGEGENG